LLEVNQWLTRWLKQQLSFMGAAVELSLLDASAAKKEDRVSLVVLEQVGLLEVLVLLVFWVGDWRLPCDDEVLVVAETCLFLEWVAQLTVDYLEVMSDKKRFQEVLLLLMES
jgi:hypothetical protein